MINHIVIGNNAHWSWFDTVFDVCKCRQSFILSVEGGIGLSILINMLTEYDGKKDMYIMVIVLVVYMCLYLWLYGKDSNEHSMGLVLNSMIDMLLVSLVVLPKFSCIFYGIHAFMQSYNQIQCYQSIAENISQIV